MVATKVGTPSAHPTPTNAAVHDARHILVMTKVWPCQRCQRAVAWGLSRPKMELAARTGTA